LYFDEPVGQPADTLTALPSNSSLFAYLARRTWASHLNYLFFWSNQTIMPIPPIVAVFLGIPVVGVLFGNAGGNGTPSIMKHDTL
jgi:hypothetical protein